MAKNKKEKLEDINLRDEFDFGPEEDFDSLFEEPKDDRSPARKIFSGTIDAAKDSALSFEVWNEKILKKVLPNDYAEVLDSSDEYTSAITDLYDESVETLRPSAYRLSRTIEKLVPGEKNIIKRFFKGATEKLAPDERYTEASSETSREDSLKAVLSEVFQSHQEQSKEAITEEKARERVENKIKDQIDTKLSADQRSILASIDKNISLLTQYTTKHNANFQRKSLEVQYRSYFVQSDLLDLSKKYFELFKTQNESVVKNTSLPDYVKITDFELASEQGKRRLVNEVSTGIFGEGSPIQRAVKRLQTKGKNTINRARETFNSALMGIEELSNARDSGIDSYTLTGNVIGAVGVDALAEKAGTWLRKKNPLDKLDTFFPNALPGKVIKNKLSKTNEILKNPSGFFNELKNSDSFKEDYSGNAIKEFFKSMARSVFDSFIDPSNSNILVQNSLSDLYKPAVFDNLTRKSIVTVIPSYLANILKEIKSQRSGKDEEIEVFDYKTNKLVTKNIVKSGIKSELDRSLNIQAVQKNSSYLWDDIYSKDDSGKDLFKTHLKLDDTEKRAIIEVSSLLKLRGTFNGVESLIKGDGKKLLIQTLNKYGANKGKRGYAIFTKLNKVFGLDDKGELIHGNENQLKNRRYFSDFINTYINSSNIPTLLIQHMEEIGNIDLITDSGIIEQYKNGYVNLSRDKLAKAFGGGFDTYSNDTELIELGVESNEEKKETRPKAGKNINNSKINFDSIVQPIKLMSSRLEEKLNEVINIGFKPVIKTTEKIYNFLKECGCAKKDSENIFRATSHSKEPFKQLETLIEETKKSTEETKNPTRSTRDQSNLPRESRKKRTAPDSPPGLGFAGNNNGPFDSILKLFSERKNKVEDKTQQSKLNSILSKLGMVSTLGSLANNAFAGTEEITEATSFLTDTLGIAGGALLPFDMMGIPVSAVLGLASTIPKIINGIKKSKQNNSQNLTKDITTGVALPSDSSSSNNLMDEFKKKITPIKNKVLNFKYVKTMLSQKDIKTAITKLIDQVGQDLSESEKQKKIDELIEIHTNIKKEKGIKEANKVIFDILFKATKENSFNFITKIKDNVTKNLIEEEGRQELINNLRTKKDNLITTIKDANIADRVNTQREEISSVLSDFAKKNPNLKVSSLLERLSKKIKPEELIIASNVDQIEEQSKTRGVIEKLFLFFKLKEEHDKKKEENTFNDKDGDGDRDGNWMDRLKNHTLLKRSERAKDPEKKEKNNGIFGSMLGMLGSLTSGIFNLAKLVPGLTTAITALSSIIPLALKGAWTLVKGAGALVKGAWKAGKWVNNKIGNKVITKGLGLAGKGLLTVAKFGVRFLGPIGMAVGAGMLAYDTYQWWKHRRFKHELDKARFIQYGVRTENEEYNVARVNYLEEELFKKGVVTIDSKGKVILRLEKLNRKEVWEVFEINEDDPKAQENFNIWFNRRFWPVFSKHLNTLYGLDQKTVNFEKIKELSKENIIRYLESVRHISDVLDVDVSPFKGQELINISKQDVNIVYDALITKYREKEKTTKDGMNSSPSSGLLDSAATRLRKKREAEEKKALEDSKKEAMKIDPIVRENIARARTERQKIINNSFNLEGAGNLADNINNGFTGTTPNDYSDIQIPNTEVNKNSIMTKGIEPKPNYIDLSNSIPNINNTNLDAKRSRQILEDAAIKAGIVDKKELAMFMAQMGHETQGFTRLIENSNGEKYEGRSDLGNTQKGDGPRYKGRGYPHLTGRYNYERYGKIIGEDLVNNPEKASDPLIAAKIAIAYWRDKQIDVPAKQGDIEKVTRLMSGGMNGFEDRQNRYGREIAYYDQKGVPTTDSLKSPEVRGDNQKYIGIVKNKETVDLDGVQKTFMNNFAGMAEEYNKLTGKNIIITQGKRSYKEQKILYEQNPNYAAKPGSSLHEKGLAIDANRTELNEADKMGLLQKYGLVRPLINAKHPEPWHVEPIGVREQKALVMSDPSKANAIIKPYGEDGEEPTPSANILSENPVNQVVGLKPQSIESQKGELSDEFIKKARDEEKQNSLKNLRSMNQRVFREENIFNNLSKQLTAFGSLKEEVESVFEILNKSYEVQLKQLHALEKIASMDLHEKPLEKPNESVSSKNKRPSFKEELPPPIVPVSRNNF